MMGGDSTEYGPGSYRGQIGTSSPVHCQIVVHSGTTHQRRKRERGVGWRQVGLAVMVRADWAWLHDELERRKRKRATGRGRVALKTVEESKSEENNDRFVWTGRIDGDGDGDR